MKYNVKKSLNSVDWFSFLTLAGALICVPGLTMGQPAPQDEEEYEGPLYFKPATPRPYLAHQEKVIEGDGDVLTLHYYSSSIMTMKFTQPLKNWSRRQDPNSSASFYLRSNGKIRFSISLYNTEEFIPDISSESLKGYIEGLKVTYEDRTEFLNDDGNYRPSGQSLWPLDQPNKVIIYTISDLENGNSTKYYEYFLVVNKHILVGSLYGPEPDVDGTAKRSFQNLFFSAVLIE